jgi:thiol-disulfide isomerase/thioredoxin
MLSRSVTSFLWIVLLWASATPSAVAGIDGCFLVESERARIDCLEHALSEAPADLKALRLLEERVDFMPGEVLAAVRMIDESKGPVTTAPHLRARLLDLRGRALSAMGRKTEAAASLAEALSFDDGTRRLTRLNPDGTRSYSSALDMGTGRLARTARCMQAAGRPEEAAGPLSLALQLGADGDLEAMWTELRGGPLPGRDATTTSLFASEWYRPLPDLDIELFAGGTVALPEEVRGKVVVLSFWATWCEPCRRELPRLQALYEAERERGLEVFAVNAEEPREIAMSFATEMGLTMPIARSSRELLEYFDTSSLPLVAVADRTGRVRGRWAGYRPGAEEDIASMAIQLLAEETPPRNQVAEILLGGGSLQVAWRRTAPTMVDDLAVAPQNGAAAGLLVAAGKSLILYDELGQAVRTWQSPVSIGRLARSKPAGDGRFQLVGFKPGSTSLLALEMPEGAHLRWSAASPVFDAVYRTVAGDGQPSALLLATLAGLQRAPAAGEPAVAVEAIVAGASSVLCLSEDDSTMTAVLDLEGTVTWLDASGATVGRAETPPGSWSLVGGGPLAVGVVPSGVVAAAPGRFLEAEGSQLALATDLGQLVIVEESTGRVLFRARWEGIAALAAADLIPGNRDELAVAVGDTVTVLTAQKE